MVLFFVLFLVGGFEMGYSLVGIGESLWNFFEIFFIFFLFLNILGVWWFMVPVLFDEFLMQFGTVDCTVFGSWENGG